MNIKPSSLGNLVLPRIGDILFLAVFITALLMGQRMLNIDGDLGRHITIGNYILQSGRIPTRDIFSHTMVNEPLVPHEWISQTMFALFHSWMGLDGVVILCAIILALSFFLLFRHTLRKSNLPYISLMLCLFAVAASSIHWLTRPHLFTLLFTVFWIIGVERINQGNFKKWWLMPVMMLVWANTHGAYIIGFVIYALYGFGNLIDGKTSTVQQNEGNRYYWRRWTAIGVSILVVTLLNPAGWKLWSTSVGYIQNKYLVGHTAEYLPPNFHDISTWPFLGFVLVSILIFGIKKVKIPTAHIILLACWTAMGLFSARNIPIYVLLAVPILAEAISQELSTVSRIEQYIKFEYRLCSLESRLVGYIIPGISLMAILFSFQTSYLLNHRLEKYNFDENVFPVAALDWISTHHVDGPMFNYFTWGGYLLYRMWPENLVFIDGQTDFYGENLTRQYEQVITGLENWDKVLDEYSVDWVLIPNDTALTRVLLSDSNWTLVYQDPLAVLFTHK
jgi:hypothetical protein